MKLIGLFFLVILLTGCTTKRRDFPERIFDLLEKHATTVTDTISDGMEERVDTRAQLPQNFSLAVYFRPPINPDARWKWTQKDKEKIFSTLEELKEGKVGRVFELINTGNGSVMEPRALRTMAAQQGADALLIVQGVAEVDTNFNPWALSYIAIAPLFFVEGNDVNSAFVSQAILWDVRKSFVHLGVQSEGEWSMKRPALFKQKNRAVKKSREESMRTLTSKLKKNFQEVVL